MKDKFLRKLLPQIHKKIEQLAPGNRSLHSFFENPDLHFLYETISGDLIKLLAMSEEQIDLLLAYLYENLRENATDYEDIETFRKPKLRTIKIDKDVFWTVRDTETFKPESYFPSMAAYMVDNEIGVDAYGERSELDWIEIQDTNYTLGSN